MLGSDGLPAGLLIVVLLGSMLGLGWHALFGRRFWQLPVYWLGGVSGFFAGTVVSGALGWASYRLGTVPVVEGTVGALVLLGLLWLFVAPSAPPRQRGGRRIGREPEPPAGKG
ncbi:MAG: hypothetical protein RMK01_11185 [Thermomicrobium sp.]|nr:hypothetical protein [Thermomicrobium sp.]MDW8060627.1 hypothetical protein [Thermomicrobium sp.]